VTILIVVVIGFNEKEAVDVDENHQEYHDHEKSILLSLKISGYQYVQGDVYCYDINSELGYYHLRKIQFLC